MEELLKLKDVCCIMWGRRGIEQQIDKENRRIPTMRNGHIKTVLSFEGALWAQALNAFERNPPVSFIQKVKRFFGLYADPIPRKFSFA